MFIKWIVYIVFIVTCADISVKDSCALRIYDAKTTIPYKRIVPRI